MNCFISLLLLVLFLFSCSRSPETSPLVEGKGDTLTNSSTSASAEGDQLKLLSASHPNDLVVKSILNKIDVLVPTDFMVMDVDKVLVKYPSKRSAVFQVYTSKDATVNIAFEHTPNKAKLQDLLAIKQVFEQQFNQPGIDFRNSEIRKINGRDFIVIEMITPAVDTRVYNLMFVTSLDGTLLMGTVNCTVDKQKEWEPIMKQVVSSVKVRS